MYQNGKFLTGKAYFTPGKVTLPPLKNIPLTPLCLIVPAIPWKKGWNEAHNNNVHCVLKNVSPSKIAVYSHIFWWIFTLGQKDIRVRAHLPTQQKRGQISSRGLLKWFTPNWSIYANLVTVSTYTRYMGLGQGILKGESGLSLTPLLTLWGSGHIDRHVWRWVIVPSEFERLFVILAYYVATG